MYQPLQRCSFIYEGDKVNTIPLPTLAAALQHIEKAARDPCRGGFLLVDVSVRGVGFNYLICRDDWIASLHSLPGVLPWHWSQSAMCSRMINKIDWRFVQGFLERVSHNTGTTLATLAFHFANEEREHILLWQEGKPYQELDSGFIWQTLLWPQLQYSLKEPLSCLVPMHTSVKDQVEMFLEYQVRKSFRTLAG